MRPVLVVFIVLLLGSISISLQWQTNYYFVQFRVLTIPDAESAKVIDEKMKTKSGIIDSRADHVTSTYFCLLAPDADYTKENFVTWFSKMGYEIACYSRGIQNTDPMISPHVLKSCVEEKAE